MGMIQKAHDKKIIALCMMFVCCMTVLFEQRAYAAPGSDPVTLPGIQTFTKPDASAADDTFTYKLTAIETGNPMPAGSMGDVYTFTASGTGSMDIGPVTFTHVGMYHYEAAQSVPSPKTGYTYDTKVYTITVYINTALEADVIIQKEDGGKVDSMEFENRYAPLASDPSIMVDPPVKKTVSGSPGVDGTFTFKLEAEDRSNPMPVGSKDGVKRMTIIGPGEADFGTWSYTETGTYKYTVSEVDNGETGYTYDAAVYTITDSVTDTAGQLTVGRTVTNAANKQVDSYDFINKYHSAAGGSGPTGSGGKTGSTANGPKTGDDTMIEFYQTMLFIGGIVLMALVVYRIMNRKRVPDALHPRYRSGWR